MKSIFEKIIDGELPCDKVYESETILAIKDLHPIAPLHLLIMPKKHYPNLQSIPEAELSIVQEIASVARELAKEFGVETNYRLLTNNGEEAGQTIFHLHFHLIGGKTLGGMG